jgi:dTDP-4-dehydrorhamnose reductase
VKVLITGARGLLGMDTVEVFSKQHEVVPLGRGELDVTDAAETISTIQDAKPDLVLHFAGFRDLDECELNPDKAYLVNTLGTRNVALGCRKAGAAMLYSSSGCVYSAEKREPYTEFDETDPMNLYGRSKLLAERAMESFLDRYFIVRLPLLFGKHGKRGRNPVVGILRTAQEKGEAPGITDQIGSIGYTVHMARAMSQLVETELYGIYHISNKGSCSRYELTAEVIKQAGLEGIKIRPIASAELERPANRGRYCILRNFCLESTIGLSLPSWQEALRECLQAILP